MSALPLPVALLGWSILGATLPQWAPPYVDTFDYALGRGVAAGGTKGKPDFPRYYASGKFTDPNPDPGYSPGDYPPDENGGFQLSKSLNDILGDMRYILPIAILGGVYLKYRSN